MKKSILFITSFFLCVFCLKSNAQQSRPEVTWENMEGVTVPIPPQVHPRLYVRSADLPGLKKRMEHPHVKEVLATLNKLGKDRTPEEEAKVKDRGFRYYFEMRGVTSRVQVQALDYLVYGDKKQVARFQVPLALVDGVGAGAAFQVKNFAISVGVLVRHAEHRAVQSTLYININSLLLQFFRRAGVGVVLHRFAFGPHWQRRTFIKL